MNNNQTVNESVQEDLDIFNNVFGEKLESPDIFNNTIIRKSYDAVRNGGITISIGNIGLDIVLNDFNKNRNILLQHTHINDSTYKTFRLKAKHFVINIRLNNDNKVKNVDI